MKKILFVFLIGLCAYVFGEGTVTETVSETRAIKKIKLAWTTSTNGWASTTSTFGGVIQRITYTSGSGSDAPINAYDVTLKDDDGLDVLLGTGANALSNVATTVYAATNGLPVAVDGVHSLVVTNAGSLKSGAVSIFLR